MPHGGLLENFLFVQRTHLWLEKATSEWCSSLGLLEAPFRAVATMGGGGGNEEPADAAPGKESVLCAAASGCPGRDAAEGSVSPQERRAPGRLSRCGESECPSPRMKSSHCGFGNYCQDSW